MHDRTDYLAGNELEKKWDEINKKKKLANNNEEEPENLIKNKIPICLICQNPLKDPVVKTKCDHLFCRSCAINRYQKFSTCATCGVQTLGIFNTEKKIFIRLSYSENNIMIITTTIKKK